MRLTTITIHQVDGGERWLAVSEPDRAAVERDPAMVATVRPYACLDVTARGDKEWQRLRGPETDTPQGRAAIRRALDNEDL